MLDIYILLLGCWTDNIAPETRNISDQALASPPFFSHFYTRWRPYIVSWMPNQLRLAGNVGSTSQALSYSTSTVHTRERESTILYFSLLQVLFSSIYISTTTSADVTSELLCVYCITWIPFQMEGKCTTRTTVESSTTIWNVSKSCCFFFFQRKCDEEIRWNQLEKFLIFFFLSCSKLLLCLHFLF